MSILRLQTATSTTTPTVPRFVCSYVALSPSSLPLYLPLLPPSPVSNHSSLLLLPPSLSLPLPPSLSLPLPPSLQGSQCKFRHCSAALGTEEACDLWLNGGECRRQVCAFRHSMSEVSSLPNRVRGEQGCKIFHSHSSQRQRNAIPCYWEGQPVGCLKPHCPFLHAKPRPKTPSVFDRLDQFKTTG